MMALLAPGALLAAALGAACWPWTAAYDRRPTVRLLVALVATSGLIVGLQELLGLTGFLAPGPLASLASLVVMLLAGSYLLRRAHRPRPPAGTRSRALAPPTPAGLALGLLTLVVYLWLLNVGALVPPYGWDTLAYHLADVFHFARSHSLSLFPHPSYPFFYPKAGELHSLWFFLLAGAGDQAWRVTGVGLIPLALTAGVAARAAAEALGFRAALPWIVPAVMLAPVVVIQPLLGYLDVAFAAFLLAAFAFALLAAVEGRPSHLAFCALALGLTFGVKASAAYYCLPVLLVLATPQAWRWLRGPGAGRPLRWLALTVGVFAVGAGFWYGRNWISHGNPFYPVSVQIAGVHVFSGPVGFPRGGYHQEWFVPSTLDWLRYPFYETYGGKPAYSSGNGFGPQFAVGVVATLVALALAARRRQWTLLRALLALPVTAILLVTVSPFVEPRYVIAACGFATLGLAVLADEVAGAGAPARSGLRRRLPLLLLHLAVAASLVFSALGGAANAADRLDEVLRRWRAGTWSPETYYALEYGTAGEAANWLSEHGGPDVRVSYVNQMFFAPLFGWHDRNRVVWATTADDIYPGRAPRMASYPEWRAFLERERVDWVVEWVPWWGDTHRDPMAIWIAEHPADFVLEKDFGRMRIWRPRPGPEAPGTPPGGGATTRSTGAPATPFSPETSVGFVARGRRCR